MKMAVTQCVRRDTQHGVISWANFLFFVTFYDRIALSNLTESSGGDRVERGGELAPRSSQGRLSDCFWAIGKTNGPDPTPLR